MDANGKLAIRTLQECKQPATKTVPVEKSDPIEPDPPEPHWPAVVAALVIALLYLALPMWMVAGPRWLAPVAVFGLMVPTIITNYREHHRLNHVLGYVLTAVLTIFVIWSLVMLVRAVPQKKEPPLELLRSAVSMWTANVLVFALWYWRIDGGGPIGRDQVEGYESGAFLFPQMTRDGKKAWEAPAEGVLWSPQFIDYLFLAFNTSTAFSPTDTPVLSRWAKALTMIQASISLTVVVLLTARAVNIL